MPVSLLFCEGGAASPDVRLLGLILRGAGVEVAPAGGKDGFRSLVRSWRGLAEVEARGPRVCGIIDGDFPRHPGAWSAPLEDAPLQWKVRENAAEVVLGWRWCRKEIENYFVDPAVLQRAFKWDDQARQSYTDHLEIVFSGLEVVTAARMALTASAPQRVRVETELPLDLSPDQAEEALAQRAKDHSEGASLDAAGLVRVFQDVLPDCRRGGKFRQHALSTFAGKNILSRIQNTAGFDRALKRRDALFETILEALARDVSPHSWLPEWSGLRSCVESWEPTGCGLRV